MMVVVMTTIIVLHMRSRAILTSSSVRNNAIHISIHASSHTNTLSADGIANDMLQTI